MRRRAVIGGLLAAALANRARAQGFAGLGTDADGFAVPERGTQLVFPADHGPHPDYRIEWWYLTVTLRGSDGRAYGVQWTLFRSALAPGGDQLWMGHAALTTPDRHHSAERLGRGGTGQAGARLPLEAWIDEWSMTGDPARPDQMDAMRVRAGNATFRYDLKLEAEGPLIFHGDAGYSVKSEAGQASYYYSQPFLRAAGVIETADGPVEVTGEGWLDREWSSQPLAQDQVGWDWFSLHFGDGTRMMAFGLRDRDGGSFTSGTWITPDGTTTALPDGAVRLTPLDTARVEGRDIPVRWRVEYPDQGVDVTVSAENDACWMATSVPYWEGPVAVQGSHSGRGYLEMTGYEERTDNP